MKSSQVLKNQGLRGFFRLRWMRFEYKNINLLEDDTKQEFVYYSAMI